MDRASRTAQCSHNTIVLVLVVVLVLENPDRFAIRLTEQISCRTSVSLRSRNPNAPRTSTTTRTRTIPNFGIWAKRLPHQLLHFGIRNRCCLDRRKISGVAKLAGKAPRGL